MLISACVSTQAQKHRRVKRPAVKVEAEPSPEEKLYASMLPSTAKIMFIDSLVVDRDSFLTKIPLNKESGEIMSYNKFFNKAKKTSVMMETNPIMRKMTLSKGIRSIAWTGLAINGVNAPR